MSVFGNNSMIPSGTLNNNRPQDNDKRKGKKPFRTKSKPRNNNGNTDSSTGNSKGNSNGPRKPFKQGNTKVKKDPVDTEAMVDPLPPSRVIPKSSVEYQSFGNDDIQQTGPVVSNISALGYKPKKTQPREFPKYLLNQPRLLVPLPFQQHEWDKANQQKMLDMETQNNGSDFLGLYEEFQQMRETERKKMEELGLVDAENIRKDLTDAISFRGTCLDMCPTFERVRRALENNVKAFEKDPTTNKICRERAVKAFSRPAAGQPPPLPSEVRPPFILTKSLDYLVENILPKLPDSHSFIWDRTRSIRQDFTYQNYYGPEAIDCNERIVRIHLISLHVMAGSKVEYSQQQELEQFNKALQTLVEIYQDVRNHGGHCPNEAEFRAYYLISHLRESEIEYEIQQLPKDILDNYLVKLALQIRKIVSQNNVVERGFKNTNGSLNLFVEFFSLVYDKSTPFLMACLLETQFNEIRFYAIKAMTRSYHTKGKAYDASILQKMLGFDKLEELTRFLNYYEIDTFNEDGQVLVDLVNKEKLESKQYKINSINDKPRLSQAYSTQINKKINVELKVFVNSGKLNSNLQLKSVKQIKAVPTISNNNNKLDDLRSRLMKTRESKKNTPDVVDSKPVSNGLKPITNVKPEPSLPTLAFQQPQFSFTKQKEEHNEEPAAVPVEIPTIDFKSKIKPVAEPKKDTAFNLQPIKKDPPTFTFKSTDQPSKTVGGIKSNSTPVTAKLPEIAKTPQPVVPTPSLTIPVAPQTKKLSESPHFKQASEAVVSQIISQTIDEELNKYLPKVINHNNKVREKERIVDLFGNQLYDAFMNEILFKLCMDQQAAKVNTKNMLAKYFTILRKKSEKLRSVNELKKRRLNELNEISFNTLKRLTSNSSFSQTKRRRWNESIDSIVEKRDEITRLWAPVGFNYFLNRVSNAVGASSFKEVKFLLLVENWRLNYSKWLSSKLGLQLNKEEKVYERTLEDTIKVKLTTLPKNQLNEDFLKNALFVLFECGLADDSDKRSIGDKLKRDGKILNKVLKVVKKVSKFDVRVLVVYWDVSNSKLTPGEIKQYLNTDDIILCDMTGDDINEILASGINELSRTIKPLSKEPKEFNKPKLKASESTIDDNKFKDMELKLIKKAKLDKKYSYLNNHSMVNQLFNTSKLNLSRLNNSTLNPNISNIMHSNILDNSFLNQSIIEESTPFASPKRSSTPTVVKNKLHKKGSLQQLIDLTTKVKSKYRQ